MSVVDRVRRQPQHFIYEASTRCSRFCGIRHSGMRAVDSGIAARTARANGDAASGCELPADNDICAAASADATSSDLYADAAASGSAKLSGSSEGARQGWFRRQPVRPGCWIYRCAGLSSGHGGARPVHWQDLSGDLIYPERIRSPSAYKIAGPVVPGPAIVTNPTPKFPRSNESLIPHKRISPQRLRRCWRSRRLSKP